MFILPPFDLSLSFKNAPENTAYIDLLVEMDTDDSGYVPFAESPRKHKGTDFTPLNIDEGGNVLGVTKAARIHWGNNGTPRLEANGDRLTYFTGTMSDRRTPYL